MLRQLRQFFLPGFAVGLLLQLGHGQRQAVGFLLQLRQTALGGIAFGLFLRCGNPAGDALQGQAQGSGIAFTLPLTGASNIALRMMTHAAEQVAATQNGKDDYVMADIKYTLISAVVNRGFSGDVMEAARTAGARGGTVIHSRCIENKEAAGMWGLGLQEEKELVLILAETEDKLAIMRAVSESCGMHSEAKGLVVSLPVDSVMGI
jgi:hypothetical protein